jgi:hypothetical protein
MKRLFLIFLFFYSTILMAGDGHGFGGGFTRGHFVGDGDGIGGGLSREAFRVPFWEKFKEIEALEKEKEEIFIYSGASIESDKISSGIIATLK